jgi:hypothetical protein
MHKTSLHTLTAISLIAIASPALAQEASNTAVTSPFQVVGNVPPICAGGTLSSFNGTYDVGTMIDTSTGFLLPNLSAPSKILTGSYCTARSSITINATPMTAQNATATPPAGFSRTVNFTATASGWTASPATFTTGAATNAAALQTRNTAYTGDITVAVSGFTTGGGNTLRMVADPVYQGTVTVTLAVVN